MPPLIGAAIAAAGTIIGGEAGLGLIIAGIGMGVSSAVSDIFAPSKPTLPAAKKPEGPGHLINTQSTQETIKVIYGEMKVGVNRVYVHSTGTKYKYLHIIACFGEGPVNSLQALYLDDVAISSYGSNADYTFYSGSSSQSYDTTLYGYHNEWIDAQRNTAYARITLEYDGEKFSSVPTITAVIQGRTLYDPRTASTVYSTNNALVLWDYLTNELYGLGLSSSYLDSTSWQSAANACDSNGFSFNGAISDRESVLDTVERILDTFRGVLVWSGGTFKLLVLDYTASVMSLTEDDIIEGTASASTPSTQDLCNSIKIKYANKDNDYVFEDLPVEIAAYITEDGDVKQKEKTLLGIVGYEEAYKNGMYSIKRSRYAREYYFKCRPRALALEPGDMIDVTHSLYGWSAQRCRVAATAEQEDHTVMLTVWKEAATIYDNTPNIDTHSQYITTLPDPKTDPPDVEDVSWSEDTYVQGDNTYSQVKIVFTPPSDYPYYDHTEAYLAWGSDTTVPIADGSYLADGTLLAGAGVYRSLGKVSTGFTINNLREGQSFRLKLLVASLYNVKQSLADANSCYVTINGIGTTVSSVEDFQVIPVRQDINLRWTPLSVAETDLLYYEIRYGSSWNQSILIARVKGTMYSLNSVRPSIHTFLIKARNTAGGYSTTEGSATITTHAPVGYSELGSSPYNEDYDSGTHSNTAYEDDPSYGRLLYVNSGTSGNYTGITFDIGSVAVRRLWLSELVIHYYGTGTTWETIWGATELWTDRISSGQGWVQVLAQAICGDLRIELLYSEDDITYYTIDNFQLFMAEISLRYFKVRLYIENSSTSNYVKIEDLNTRVYAAA